MGVRYLSPIEFARMSELANKPYRLPEIIELKEKIKNEVKATELVLSVTGIVDLKSVEKIVAMKLELDSLYDKWVIGELK